MDTTVGRNKGADSRFAQEATDELKFVDSCAQKRYGILLRKNLFLLHLVFEERKHEMNVLSSSHFI